jgi:excisionase family DNA binding protein
MPTTVQKSRDKRPRAPRAEAPELRSVDFAAEFLDVSERTGRRMIHEGTLYGYRVGRLVKVDMRQVHQLATPVPPESVSA